MIIRKAAVNNFEDALKLVKKTGSDKFAHKILAKKAVLIAVVIDAIDNRAASILKQEALSAGADAAVNENVSRFKKGFSDTVLFATVKQIEILIKKLCFQPFGLKEVAAHLSEIKDSLLADKKIWKYKKTFIDILSPAVMGIINMDPQSFSGDGLTNADEAVKRAIEFEKAGAKILDIGAESSRPGAKLIDAKTEIKRLLPALKKIKKAVKIPVSIDTYKYETAKAALNEGADIINDIFALQKGKDKLAKLIANSKAGVILMHMQGVPASMQKDPSYKDCVSEVFEFLSQRKKYANSFGIKNEFIAVDPGPGFGKTVEHNLELVKNMSAFSSLGAVVGAVSRKKFIRAASSSEDKTAFVAANFLAAYCGADIVRVHDVKETVNVLKLITSIRRV
ncbi:dihydropteroate synthase [Endomicrobium proavitum]|uniref:dihydropteroate synthase n=1 Tax=Endomicrobium proavitum TaxID=1408281 RepID=A0A0G3WK23_9BACT|nr:dihydropteroate synthase [Endomicrobium proavitum]AKL98245.1 Dihydropteroate synthase [Endomicrobium proavitum]